MPISASKFFLKDYAVPVSIGIHDFEKARRQTVVINIEMYLENTDVDRNDSIENTINYDFLRSEIEILVKDRHFNLQETRIDTVQKGWFAVPPDDRTQS